MEPRVSPRALVVARCGALRVGLPVDVVEQVVAAPVPEPLPGAPPIVVGLVNFHGAPTVVLDPARRGPDVREGVTLAHRIAVVRGRHGLRGILCEAVEGPVPVADEAWSGLEDLVPGAGYLAAGAVGGDEVVVLYDPDRSLSPADELALQAALDRRQEAGR